MIHNQISALVFMFLFAIAILLPALMYWDEIGKKWKIAAFIFSALFGFPPLIILWITGVFG